ncbi:MAG: hypothetical protein IJY07_01930 [Clostridia bacterium]|nr:hypothetical protein [Clostridia bacterium]
MLLKEEEIKEIETKIGYEFNLKNLLVQAFVRRSFTNELPDYDCFDIENNEVLELLGDKVIDYIVVKKMAKMKGTVDLYFYNYTSVRGACSGMYSSTLNEGKLTDIKKSIVEKKSLATAMTKLGLQKYLVMGKGDIAMNIQESDSVKEDLFEAILGAVAIDSDWNMESLEKVLCKMHDIEDAIKNAYVNPTIDAQWEKVFSSEQYNIHYYEVGLMDKVLAPSKGRNRIEWVTLAYKEEITICDKKNKILGCYFGVAEERERAINNAKLKAIHDFQQDGTSSPICAMLATLTRENSINILNELCQKGLIEKKEEYIQNSKDEDGNPLWDGKLQIENYGLCVAQEFYSKKELKKEIAYRALQEIQKIAKGKYELFPLIYNSRILGKGRVIAVVKDGFVENNEWKDLLEIQLDDGSIKSCLLDEQFVLEDDHTLTSLIQAYYREKGKQKSNENIIWYDQNIEDKNDEMQALFQLIGAKVWDERLGEGIVIDIINNDNLLIEMKKESCFANHTFSYDHICEHMAFEKEKGELLASLPKYRSVSLYEMAKDKEGEVSICRQSQYDEIPEEILPLLQQFLNNNEYFTVAKVQYECRIGYLLAKKIQDRLIKMGIILERSSDKGNFIVKEKVEECKTLNFQNNKN